MTKQNKFFIKGKLGFINIWYKDKYITIIVDRKDLWKCVMKTPWYINPIHTGSFRIVSSNGLILARFLLGLDRANKPNIRVYHVNGDYRDHRKANLIRDYTDWKYTEDGFENAKAKQIPILS